MRQRVAALVVASSVVVGSAGGFALQRATDEPAAAVGPASTSAGDPTASPAVTAALLAPGRLGPQRGGMTQRQWEPTGALVRDTVREQSCEGIFWRWRGALGRSADVITDRENTVVSLGVIRPGPATRAGIQVGSTYADLRRAYGTRLSGPTPNDYGQSRLLVRQGSAWMGFLLDPAPEALRDSSPVVFMEASRGREPGLLRDGC